MLEVDRLDCLPKSISLIYYIGLGMYGLSLSVLSAVTDMTDFRPTQMLSWHIFSHSPKFDEGVGPRVLP